MIEQQPKQTTVMLADDHQLLRDGFRAALERCDNIQLLEAVSSAEDLLLLLEQNLPDLVVTDFHFNQEGAMDGIEAARLIRFRWPKVKIIAFSGYSEGYLIYEMVLIGVEGFLVKTAPNEELIKAIETVSSGRPYFCAEASRQIMIHTGGKIPLPVNKPMFSDRQKQIIVLIAQEKTSQEIADILCLSVRTVDSHRRKIQEKIGTSKSIGIAIYATRHGYI